MPWAPPVIRALLVFSLIAACRVRPRRRRSDELLFARVLDANCRGQSIQNTRSRWVICIEVMWLLGWRVPDLPCHREALALRAVVVTVVLRRRHHRPNGEMHSLLQVFMIGSVADALTGMTRTAHMMPSEANFCGGQRPVSHAAATRDVQHPSPPSRAHCDEDAAGALTEMVLRPAVAPSGWRTHSRG